MLERAWIDRDDVLTRRSVCRKLVRGVSDRNGAVLCVDAERESSALRRESARLRAAADRLFGRLRGAVHLGAAGEDGRVPVPAALGVRRSGLGLAAVLVAGVPSVTDRPCDPQWATEAFW